MTSFSQAFALTLFLRSFGFYITVSSMRARAEGSAEPFHQDTVFKLKGTRLLVLDQISPERDRGAFLLGAGTVR